MINFLLEEDDMKILSLNMLGMSLNANTIFPQRLFMLHNIMINAKDAYGDRCNVIGVKYNEKDKKLVL